MEQTKAKEHAKDHALDLMSRWDKEVGELWLTDREKIAEIMVEFVKERNQEIVDIFNKGTRNRRYLKVWESKIMKICKGEE